MNSSDWCAQCGSTLDVHAFARNACRHCGAPILVRSSAALAGTDDHAIRRYAARYCSDLQSTPHACDLLLALAICYLTLKRFDDAGALLARVRNLDPSNAGAYYYSALALLRGIPPSTCPKRVIEEAEHLLFTAIELDPVDGRPDIILAAIRHDHYALNGLTMPPPTAIELVQNMRNKAVDMNEVTVDLSIIGITNSPVYAFWARA